MNSNPATLLIAVLHKAGPIIIDKVEFEKVLAKAADSDGAFQVFESHPQYHFSQVLDEELGKLVLGGLIIEHLGLRCLRVTSRLAGAFGEAELEKLTVTEKEAVEKVAKLVLNCCRWWL